MNRILVVASTTAGTQSLPAFALRFADGCGASITLCRWQPKKRLDSDSVPVSLSVCPLGNGPVLLGANTFPERKGIHNYSFRPEVQDLAHARRLGVEFRLRGSVTDLPRVLAQQTGEFDLVCLERIDDHAQLSQFLAIARCPVILCPPGAAQFSRVTLYSSQGRGVKKPDDSGADWGQWCSERLRLQLCMADARLLSTDDGDSSDTEFTVIERSAVPRRWWSLERGITSILNRFHGCLAIVPRKNPLQIRSLLEEFVWRGGAPTANLNSSIDPQEDSAISAASNTVLFAD